MVWQFVRSGIVVAAVCWVVLFWRLGRVGLMDDEAHYAQLTQEMAAQGDWLVPRLAGVAYIDKPVFFHWAQGLTTGLVADAELGARLPSALGATALFGIIAWLGAACAGRQTGRGAWLMLATVPATFLLGRTGFMDMLFSALLFGAVAFIIRALMTGSHRAQAGAVVCLAAAILTKGPIAAGLVALWLGVLWVARGRSLQELTGLRLWVAALGVCALVLPWFLWMYSQHGEAFMSNYFGRGHVDYLSPRASASSSQWTFYARMFMTSFFPWSFIAVGYGIDTARRRRRGVRVPLWENGLWLWMAIVLVVFTLIPFRVDRYIYPAAPACCLLAVRGWLAASAETRWSEFAATRAAVGIVALIFVVAGAFVWSSLPRLAVPLPAAIVLLPAALMTGGFFMIAAMARRGGGLPNLTGWPVATMMAGYAGLVYFGLPIIRAGLPVEQIGRFVADRSGAGEPVAVLGLDRWETGLAYYLRQAPERLQDASAAQRFANAPGSRWVIMRRNWHDQVAARGCITLAVPAIVGTKGRGIRTQVWEDVIVIKYDAKPDHTTSTCPGP